MAKAPTIPSRRDRNVRTVARQLDAIRDFVSWCEQNATTMPAVNVISSGDYAFTLYPSTVEEYDACVAWIMTDGGLVDTRAVAALEGHVHGLESVTDYRHDIEAWEAEGITTVARSWGPMSINIEALTETIR